MFAEKEKSSSATTKILVLYCGGTVGMKETSEGTFAPQKGFLLSELVKRPQFHDPMHKPLTCVLATGRKVRYLIKEYDPLLDSSDMNYTHWIKIATDIRDQYNKFDAFVILHGTDTMAYTASALSFMFKGLSKTIILTGSQIPFDRAHSDAVENIFGALMLAAHFQIPEVCIYFHHKLFRGNRSKKVSSEGFAAFDSENYPPLVEVGIHYDVKWSLIRPLTKERPFEVFTELNAHIAVLYLHPGIEIQIIKNILAPPTEGCVVMSFGTGNAPTAPEFLQVFQDAIARNVIIVNISQCWKGATATEYAAGKKFIDVGVLNCFDMSAEAAVGKLAVYLGKSNLTIAQKRDKLSRNLRGELTEKVQERHDKMLQDTHSLCTVWRTMRQKLARKELYAIVPTIICTASAQGNMDVIRDVVERKFDVNVCDYDKRTGLHMAALNGKLEIVKFLIHSGALSNLKDQSGNSPYDLAKQGNHEEICNFLESLGKV